jgi:hypothetical protein
LEQPIRFLALSPSGRWVLSQDPLLWRADWGVEPVALRGAPDVMSASSSDDGKILATGHQNGNVSIWHIDLDPISLTQRLWKATQYCLSYEQRRDLLGEDRIPP